MMMVVRATNLCAGIELGGTKCVCIVARAPGEVLARARIATRDPCTTLAEIACVLGTWKSEYGFTALGVASFGPLDLTPRSTTYGAIMRTPKPGWSGTGLLAVADNLGVPAAIDTDVNAAALAEGRWGAARGLSTFAYLTVGTGVGVGSVVNGAPVRGLGHSEAGHMRVSRSPGDGWVGACPYHGDCVEGLASGPAIAAFAGEDAANLQSDHPAWDVAIGALAGLCHNLVLALAPQRILIGGGVASGQPHVLPRLREAVAASLNGYAQGVEITEQINDFIVAPGLGGDAGALGAIALAQTMSSQSVVPEDFVA